MPTGYGVPEGKLVEKGLAERILRSARWARSAITSGLPPVPTAGGRALATRIAGMLLLAGAVLIVVTVALPPAAGGSDLLILAYGLIAGAVGAVLVARRRVSEPVLGAVAALGTAVITLATLEAGAGTGAEDNEVLYLWVSLFCFWFFGLRHALLQLALIGIADAVLLIDQSPMFAAGVTRWVVTVSTLAVTGLLGAWLRRSLEREREEAARLAVVAERMRIAREVHDAAGHGVTAVSIQAAAGLRSLDSDTEATREALEEIKRTSRVTMEDMRRLLGILRPGTEGEAQLHRVSLAGVNTLIEEVERAGLPVALEVSGKRSPLPTALDQAAYRIAQEALTNALKHAGRGAKAALNLTYGPENLELEITDDGGGNGVELPRGTKKGLIGMRERVEMFGGAFEAGPLPGAGFRVRARLPLGERIAGDPTGV
jgi:signal transduction histidine kinase